MRYIAPSMSYIYIYKCCALDHSAVVQNGEVPSVHKVRLMSLVRNTNSKDCDIQGIRDGPHLNFYPSPVERC